MEGRPVLLVTNIKDYHGIKISSNVINSRETIADMLRIKGGIEYTGRHWMEKGEVGAVTPLPIRFECVKLAIMTIVPLQIIQANPTYKWVKQQVRDLRTRGLKQKV